MLLLLRLFTIRTMLLFKRSLISFILSKTKVLEIFKTFSENTKQDCITLKLIGKLEYLIPLKSFIVKHLSVATWLNTFLTMS